MSEVSRVRAPWVRTRLRTAPGAACALTAVAVPPLLVIAGLALRRADPVVSLREPGGE
ncbi:hypothetical protein [Streptomyces sp. NPDC047043]|uniref:hypothetical protein n=1 Tax=Streptomyces sp. NPDC047043 TaxID=3154497 RepID=UPI0033F83F0F